VLIRAYGLFWKADEIDWNPVRGGGRDELPKFALLGRRGSRASGLRVADFMDQRGIYILYGDYGPHYVGVTSRRGLGVRLKEHRTDRHSNRWDRFSWYGFWTVGRRRDPLGLSVLSEMAETKSVVQSHMILEMESLLIHAMGLHNIHKGRFPAGEEWTQIRRDEQEDYMGRLQSGRRRPTNAAQPRVRTRQRRGNDHWIPTAQSRPR
jgi:hypothetical protein